MIQVVRAFMVIATLVGTLAAGAAHHAGAQTDDDDSFSTYGAEPHDLPEDAVEMVVHSVVDGDTLRLTYPGDDWYYPVRIIGIDSPEKDGPYTDAECYGNESTSELAKLLPKGTTVYVEKDVTDEDRNGRWLRHVWLPYAEDGVDVEDKAYLVSEILVLGGTADAKQYKPDDEYDDILKDAEEDAREHDAGFWGAC
jgi:micrococcal nuclease